MAIVDCVIIGLACYLLFSFWKNYAEMCRLDLARGMALIVAGLLVFAGFYLLDLATMLVLPYFVGGVRATALMEYLHLEWSWIDTMFGLGFVSVGVTMLRRRLLSRLSRAFDEAAAEIGAIL